MDGSDRFSILREFREQSFDFAYYEREALQFEKLLAFQPFHEFVELVDKYTSWKDYRSKLSCELYAAVSDLLSLLNVRLPVFFELRKSVPSFTCFHAQGGEVLRDDLWELDSRVCVCSLIHQMQYVSREVKLQDPKASLPVNEFSGRACDFLGKSGCLKMKTPLNLVVYLLEVLKEFNKQHKWVHPNSLSWSKTALMRLYKRRSDIDSPGFLPKELTEQCDRKPTKLRIQNTRDLRP